jgi:hypothetical protein
VNEDNVLTRRDRELAQEWSDEERSAMLVRKVDRDVEYWRTHRFDSDRPRRRRAR